MKGNGGQECCPVLPKSESAEECVESFPEHLGSKHVGQSDIASVSKGAIFALLLRYFYTVGAQHFRPVFVLFAIIAIASMLIGNLLALLQNNVKRILASSSIADMGYLLVAFGASSTMASEAVASYLVAYFITTVGAFGVVAVLSDEERDADTLEDYAGLFWRRRLHDVPDET